MDIYRAVYAEDVIGIFGNGPAIRGIDDFLESHKLMYENLDSAVPTIFSRGEFSLI
jgi:hypothetical protein